MRYYVIVSVVFLLGACSPRLIPVPSPTQIPTTDLPTVLTTPNPQVEKNLSLAIEDLAIRLSLDPELIHVISAEPVLWQDAGLGCPIEGRIYAQKAVPGYQIRLEAAGQEYVYHTDDSGEIILCPDVKPDEPGLR